jgi:DNA-binding MarR family transcriptional regulator
LEVVFVASRPEVLLVLLKEVYGALHSVARETWHGYGMARPAALVMRQIDRCPGMTVSKLSRMTGMAKSNVSKSVESLVQKKYVLKKKDLKDQRQVLLFPTDKAKKHFTQMWNGSVLRLKEVVEGVPEDEIDSIIDALKTFKGVIEKSAKKSS